MSVGWGEQEAETRVKRCPSCGNQTPQKLLYWQDAEDWIEGTTTLPDGTVEQEAHLLDVRYFFTRCCTCGHPSVFVDTNLYVGDDSFGDATLAWPAKEPQGPAATPPAKEELHLAAAAELLASQGHEQAAALLLDVRGVAYTDYWDEYSEAVTITAVLRVEAHRVPRFSDEVQEQIRAALEQAAIGDRDYISRILLAPVASDGDWRERVAGYIGAGPVNQATLVPIADEHPQEDRLHFRDPGELAMYRAFKRAQERHANDPEGTLAIFPNAAVRVNGRTFEVDFSIVFRGRTGVVEVDGTSHSRKFASDRSRDRLLEDAGIARVDHIDIQDAERPEEADKFVERFLARLVSG